LSVKFAELSTTKPRRARRGEHWGNAEKILVKKLSWHAPEATVDDGLLMYGNFPNDDTKKGARR